MYMPHLFWVVLKFRGREIVECESRLHLEVMGLVNNADPEYSDTPVECTPGVPKASPLEESETCEDNEVAAQPNSISFQVYVTILCVLRTDFELVVCILQTLGYIVLFRVGVLNHLR